MNEFIKRTITASALTVLAGVSWLFLPPIFISLGLVAILIYILVVEWPPLKIWWLTPLYPVFPFLLLILLNHMSVRLFLLFLCLVTFAHDSGAYLVGKAIGRHKILPTISPGKTWEGFWGGYGISLVVAMFFVYNTNIKIKFWGLPVYIFMLNAAAITGDLFESYLKRRVGLKDSGTILPGHGGLLDRFDGLLFAVVALYVIILL
jgi:phosphatidate cytidylyltransferase